MGGCVNECVDIWVGRTIYNVQRYMDGCTDGWTDEVTDRRVDGRWKDELMEGWMGRMCRYMCWWMDVQMSWYMDGCTDEMD